MTATAKRKTHGFPVVQYDRAGNFIAEYPSAVAAAAAVGTHSTSITQVCNFRQDTAGGFKWRKKGDPLPQHVERERS